MAELKATVCLQGKDIEVISSHIEFNRKTDNKRKAGDKCYWRTYYYNR